MKQVAIIFLLVVLVVVLGVSIGGCDSNNINTWVENRHEVVQNVDYCPFLTGPFFPVKNARVYKVTTDKHVYWMRYGWPFGVNTYIENSGNYIPVE